MGANTFGSWTKPPQGIKSRRTRKGNRSMLMQESSTRAIYDVQSRVYDVTFGALVQRRIATAISHLDIREGDRVLDLGIGTGASLRYYPRDRGRIFGIDLSSGMLQHCRQRMHNENR